MSRYEPVPIFYLSCCTNSFPLVGDECILIEYTLKSSHLSLCELFKVEDFIFSFIF